MGPGNSVTTLQVLVVDRKFIFKDKFIFKLKGMWVPDLSCLFYLCLLVMSNSLSECHFFSHFFISREEEFHMRFFFFKIKGDKVFKVLSTVPGMQNNTINISSILSFLMMDDVTKLSPKLLTCSLDAPPVARILHLRDLDEEIYLYESFEKHYKVPK